MKIAIWDLLERKFQSKLLYKMPLCDISGITAGYDITVFQHMFPSQVAPKCFLLGLLSHLSTTKNRVHIILLWYHLAYKMLLQIRINVLWTWAFRQSVLILKLELHMHYFHGLTWHLAVLLSPTSEGCQNKFCICDDSGLFTNWQANLTGHSIPITVWHFFVWLCFFF